MAMTMDSNRILRWITAGPIAVLGAVTTMAAAPSWMPAGAAGIDNLVFPIILFPAFWAVLTLYSLLEAKPMRALAVLACVVAVNAIVIYRQF